MIKRVLREYAELRIDLSRDALKHVVMAVEHWLEENYGWQGQTSEELQNLRNVAQNLVDRFDADLCG
jgi:hypothetical protein